MIITLILFIIILGLTVFVHEFGHFTFAKLAGVHVYEFALGFGPTLWKTTAKDGTIYAVHAFPLGGFVSMAGEEVEYDPEKHKGQNIQDKSPWQRFLIMFMGVGNNFIFAFLVLLFVGLVWGAPNLKPVIDGVEENYPAALAGIEVGDVVKKINNHKVTYIDDISLYMTIEDASKPLVIDVLKSDGSTASYTVSPVKEKIEDTERYVIGITTIKETERGLIKSIIYAFKQEGALFKQMFVVLKALFTGNIGLNRLSGPVGIYSIVDDYKTDGLNSLLYLLALLCVNVGVINILPLPAFDGGRILFLIIELIKGSPVNPKFENTIHEIAFILLMLLMAYITFNDILRFF